jgi:hypothetical protein
VLVGFLFRVVKASFTLFTDLLRCLSGVRTRSSTWYPVVSPDPQPLRRHV